MDGAGSVCTSTDEAHCEMRTRVIVGAGMNSPSVKAVSDT